MRLALLELLAMELVILLLHRLDLDLALLEDIACGDDAQRRRDIRSRLGIAEPDQPLDGLHDAAREIGGELAELHVRLRIEWLAGHHRPRERTDRASVGRRTRHTGDWNRRRQESHDG